MSKRKKWKVMRDQINKMVKRFEKKWDKEKRQKQTKDDIPTGSI